MNSNESIILIKEYLPWKLNFIIFNRDGYEDKVMSENDFWYFLKKHDTKIIFDKTMWDIYLQELLEKLPFIKIDNLNIVLKSNF